MAAQRSTFTWLWLLVLLFSSCADKSLVNFPMPSTKVLLTKPENCATISHDPNLAASAINPIKVHFYPQKLYGMNLSAFEVDLSYQIVQAAAETSYECK